MTPAIKQAKTAGIEFSVHQYKHDENHPAYGLEAAEKLSLDPARVFKTLVAELEDNGILVVAIVPVAAQLDLKALAKAAGAKKAKMADVGRAEKTTGYVAGGISPLGQRKRLATYIDRSAENQRTIFVSAGRRGLEVELAPNDLISMLRGRFAPLARTS